VSREFPAVLLFPPNLICLLRIAGAGALVLLAQAGLRMPFVLLFAGLTMTDWVDGRLARRFGWRTRLGARLDSIADLTLHAAVIVSAPWLAPGALLRELPWIVAAAATYAVVFTISIVRFRRPPGYHTVAAKTGWFLVGAGIVLFFAEASPWPIRGALVVVALANLEETAIALLLPEPQVDVPTVLVALRLRRLRAEPRPLERAARPEAAGSGETPPSLRLLHVSDLHFGPPYLERVGEAVLETAAGTPCDAIVVSGDLTHLAKRGQFEAARAFLDRLPDVPRIVVPGNHDIPLYRILERLFRPRGLYREIVSNETDRAWELPGAVVAALDSTSPWRAITNGRITFDQLEFCRRAFEDAPADAAKIVVAHHHFAPAPDFELDQTMPKARRALDLFVELRVDLVLGGHLHRSYIGNSLDVYSGRDRSHGIIIVQCGTTTSRRGRAREREKNTLNLIRIDPETIRVTQSMYFEHLGGFRPVSRHEFPRPTRRVALPGDGPGRAGGTTLAVPGSERRESPDPAR